MRFRSLFLWDVRFQMRYGFYLLYAILTAIYAAILFAVPPGWREKTAAILIFSDPAAMGLFFMGAMVLLEKSQHTPCAFAVSPVRPVEYIAAKAASLSVISLAVAAALATAAGLPHIRIVLCGTFLSGVIFTLLGILIATKIASLNQFLLWTVPFEAACFTPAVLHLFGAAPDWLRYDPAGVCMEMVSGQAPSAIGITGVLAVTACLFVLSESSVASMWNRMGGANL